MKIELIFYGGDGNSIDSLDAGDTLTAELLDDGISHLFAISDKKIRINAPRICNLHFALTKRVIKRGRKYYYVYMGNMIELKFFEQKYKMNRDHIVWHELFIEQGGSKVILRFSKY